MLVPSYQSMLPTPFDGLDEGQKIVYAFLVLTPSNAGNGGYVVGGDAVDFTKLSPPPPSGYAPVQANFYSMSGASGHSGYQYYWRPGNPPTLQNGRVQVETTGNGAGNPLQELAAGAYPAGILADTIVGIAAFVRV